MNTRCLRAWGFAVLFWSIGLPAWAEAQDRSAQTEGARKKPARKAAGKAARAKAARAKAKAEAAAEAKPEAETPVATEASVPAGTKAAHKAAPSTPSEGDVHSEGGTDVKVLEFSGLDIEGQLKTPQMLYFLRRLRAEFGRPNLPHRSFLPELAQTTQDEEL